MDKVACKICNKLYLNVYTLAEHQKIVHEGRNDNHECEICKNKFATKYKLSRHMKGKLS